MKQDVVLENKNKYILRLQNDKVISGDNVLKFDNAVDAYEVFDHWGHWMKTGETLNQNAIENGTNSAMKLILVFAGLSLVLGFTLASLGLI